MDRKGRLEVKCSQVGCIQIIDLFSNVSFGLFGKMYFELSKNDKETRDMCVCVHVCVCLSVFVHVEVNFYTL